MASVTDANTHTTDFEYDERGQLIGQRFADNSTKSFAYDAFGNRTSMTNELGNQWRSAYDEFKRKVSETDPLGRSTFFDYSLGLASGGCGSCNSFSKPSLITLPSGKKTKIVYDVAWQKTSETMGYGTAEAATTSYSYDLSGNLTKITDALGHASVTTFDSRNRPLSVADPLANKTQWTYDVVSNKLTETRPDNGITTMAYDAMHRLLSQLRVVSRAQNTATSPRAQHPTPARCTNFASRTGSGPQKLKWSLRSKPSTVSSTTRSRSLRQASTSGDKTQPSVPGNCRITEGP